MYLSVNVYKIIAIIVLIPPCDDDARKRKSNGRVACENRGRGGAGRWKTSACCGTNEILKRDEYAFHKI